MCIYIYKQGPPLVVTLDQGHAVGADQEATLPERDLEGERECAQENLWFYQ